MTAFPFKRVGALGWNIGDLNFLISVINDFATSCALAPVIVKDA
jgi:hypothetical protein